MDEFSLEFRCYKIIVTDEKWDVNNKVSAVSEDGLIEGIYMPDRKFVMAVQWHPEFFYLKDENSVKIFEAFVKACSSCAEGKEN